MAPRLALPGRGGTLVRWRALAALAADDVCLAKVVEAHYDAQAILADIEDGDTAPGCLYAVWAAEPPDAQTVFVTDAGRDGTGRLDGTKAWCSGADLVDRALVTAVADGRRVLVEVGLAQPGVSPSDDDWHAVGMARVRSGRVRFDGARARQVGPAGAYLERPGFWHGGAGIAACWYGAAAAIGEHLRTHPRIPTDAHAAAHLGAIDIGLSAAAALMRETAAAIDAEPGAPHVHAVLRLRSLLERLATEVIDRVGRALGPGPLCEDAARARRCADLTTFVRQCHAERDWAALGTAAGSRASGWPL
ncbi:acyl-CoA dehydrogenase [Luteimonas sp. SJ-16]|uniref:Acyl-CoA dehydrogenase n=2 Tax=Luteimonas deserti TaxID=2752306 RepID=A0A7Z0TVT8_9GAMM|nr:acyl-CoA dehydrogenase [Luteimonas deserti]